MNNNEKLLLRTMINTILYNSSEMKFKRKDETGMKYNFDEYITLIKNHNNE